MDSWDDCSPIQQRYTTPYRGDRTTRHLWEKYTGYTWGDRTARHLEDKPAALHAGTTACGDDCTWVDRGVPGTAKLSTGGGRQIGANRASRALDQLLSPDDIQFCLAAGRLGFPGAGLRRARTISALPPVSVLEAVRLGRAAAKCDHTPLEGESAAQVASARPLGPTWGSTRVWFTVELRSSGWQLSKQARSVLQALRNAGRCRR